MDLAKENLNGDQALSKDQNKGKKVKTKKAKEFNFLKYPERRIALLFLYAGWEFDSMVLQPGMENTTEAAILNAMQKTRMIRSLEYAQWNRCGRTDKNVSGFRQVGSCIVRSTDINGKHAYWPEGSDEAERVKTTDELNFPRILNHNLPPGVRILAWAPVEKDFNARFNCKQRVYNYLFPKSNLNLERMREACQFLVGVHDFRNFCQIDNNKCRLETSYVREIFSVEISEVDSSEKVPAYQMHQLNVKGSGFLWHQIRFIVGLLFEIGSGREEPALISDLLDIECVPARPQYLMARDLPLCFFDCSYDFDLEWIFDASVLQEVFVNLEKMWADLQIKAQQLRAMMNEIAGMSLDEKIGESHIGLNQYILNGKLPSEHIPILKRPCCESLDSRIARAEEKRTRLEQESNGGDIK